MAEEKASFLDELQERLKKLTALLENRQPGATSWYVLLSEELLELHKMLCPLYKES